MQATEAWDTVLAPAGGASLVVDALGIQKGVQRPQGFLCKAEGVRLSGRG